MQITQLLNSNTLLNYSLVTSPQPLQVSPQSGPPSKAQLTFVLSCPPPNGYDQVTVTQITFNLPIGDPKAPDATDLTEVSTGISPSVSSSGSDQWQIGPGAAAGSFVLAPKGGGTAVIGAQGLAVTLTGIQVSPIVGTAELNIVEMATADKTPPQARECTIELPKFPYGFYAGNFTASAPMVQDGATVSLSWIGSVQAKYTLLWGTQSQNVSTVNQWTSPALTDTTTFILEVSAQEAGETVTLYFGITVIVADPNITATTLDVLQTSTLQGNVGIGTVTPSAPLHVVGGAMIDGSDPWQTAFAIRNQSSNKAFQFLVGGSQNNDGAAGAGGFGIYDSVGGFRFNINSNGNVGIGTTAPGSLLDVNGALNATAATLGPTTVTDLTVSGGRVSMINNSQPLTPGTWQSPASFQALTDGFAVCYIGTVPSYPTGGCICWGSGQANGITLQCTGGNVGFFGPDWDKYMANNPQSFVLPVPAGSNFYLWVQEGTNGQQVDAPYNFYWVPMGNPAGLSLAFLDKPGPDYVPPTPLNAEIGEPRSRRMEFITILERLLGKPIDEVTRQQLIGALGG